MKRFLCNLQKTHKYFSKSPSPKHKNTHRTNSGFIESVSSRISRSGKIAAGMTVEAAVVLPFFLFFFVQLGCAMEMIRLHGNIQVALWDIGNKMSVYGYASNGTDSDGGSAQRTGGSLLGELGDVAISYTYVKDQLKKELGEKYLSESPLVNGSSSLQFLKSDLVCREAGETDRINLVVTYRVAPWLTIPAAKEFVMSNRYYGRLWTGYDLRDAGKGGAEDYVYVTQTGTVYHESLSCSHLKLSITTIPKDLLKRARNEYGAKYYACDKCTKGKSGKGVDMYYITKDGTNYHQDRNCPGLKRTIRTILRKDAGKYRACKSCAGGG